MLRLLGKEFAEDTDIYSALKSIRGLDTDNSKARVEKILTKSGCFRLKTEPNQKKVKDYPLIRELSPLQKRQLMENLDLPKACVHGVRMSPRKGRLVADLVRGKKVDEAIRILRFCPNKPADIILKVLKGALANAEANHNLKADARDFSLVVKKILIDGGPSWRRFRARARGRAGRIVKRTSYIQVVLGEMKNPPIQKKKAAVNHTGKPAGQVVASETKTAAGVSAGTKE